MKVYVVVVTTVDEIDGTERSHVSEGYLSEEKAIDAAKNATHFAGQYAEVEEIDVK